MVLDGGRPSRRRVRGLTPARRCGGASPGLPTVFGWSRRSAADVMRSYFAHDALRGAAWSAARWCGASAPRLPGTGLGALGVRACATSPRSAGRSAAAVRAGGAARRRSSRRRHGAHRRAGSTAILCDADAVRGVTPRRRHRDHGARSSCRRATRSGTFVEWLQRPAGRRGGAGRALASERRTRTATSRRSTPCSPTPPVAARRRDASDSASTHDARADARRDGRRLRA